MSRSPNYPTVTLPIAIENIRVLWSLKGRAIMTAEEIVQALGYKSLSGPSRSRLSALKKYGLLDARGSGWALTPRSVTLAVKDPSSSEYREAIRASVSEVDLFRQLLVDHTESSERLLREHLITQEQFTEDGAKRAAEAFLAAKTLVGDGGVTANEETAVIAVGSADRDYSASGLPSMTMFPGQVAQSHQMSGSGTKSETFSLDNGAIVVSWPQHLTQDDFENVKDWLPILERKFKASVRKDAER